MPSDLIDRAKLLETVDLWEQENGGPAYICTTKFRSAIRSAPAAGPDLGRWIAEQRANLGNISTSHDGSADLARWRASHKLINSLEEFIGTQPPPAPAGPVLNRLLEGVLAEVVAWYETRCELSDLRTRIRAAFAAHASLAAGETATFMGVPYDRVAPPAVEPAGACEWPTEPSSETCQWRRDGSWWDVEWVEWCGEQPASWLAVRRRGYVNWYRPDELNGSVRGGWTCWRRVPSSGECEQLRKQLADLRDENLSLLDARTLAEKQLADAQAMLGEMEKGAGT